jgi:hypothetical protein
MYRIRLAAHRGGPQEQSIPNRILPSVLVVGYIQEVLN